MKFNDKTVTVVGDISEYLCKNSEGSQVPYVLFYEKIIMPRSETVEMREANAATTSFMVRSETFEIADADCSITENTFLHPGDLTLNSTFETTLCESTDTSLNDSQNQISTTSDGSSSGGKKRSQRKQSVKTKKRLSKERRAEKSKNADEKEKERERLANIRKNEQKKSLEKSLNREAKEQQRKSTRFRDKEQSQNNIDHRQRRENEEYRVKERIQDARLRALLRENEEYRERENQRNADEHRLRRLDDGYRDAERIQDAQAHVLHRQNDEYREAEQQRNTVEHQVRRANVLKLATAYEETVKEGPVYVCVSCGGLFFKRTVKEFNEIKCRSLLNAENYSKSTLAISNVCDEGKRWICITCERYIQSKRLPKIALGNGLQFVTINPLIESLNELEERLISPRIPFIRIRTLGYDYQKSIRGNVVNVPVDTNETLKFLPRQFDESKIIQLKFMRKMTYTNPYMYDKVNPAKIVQGLKYLINKPLFTKINMEIRTDWQINEVSNVLPNEQDFIVDENDRILVEAEQQAYNNNSENNNISETESEDEDHFVANRKTFENQETLLYSDVLENNKQKESEDHSIAPGEGNIHVHFLRDPHNEELCFLKIYGGEQIIPYLNNDSFKYSAICKSELRRYDRRSAINLAKVFYMYKKLVAKNLQSSIDTAMKKTKNTENLTVADTRNKEKMSELLLNSEAQIMLRSNRSSPQFWEWKKMEINAMIRQLGCPTLFMTFSPDEENWIDLLIIVTKSLENKTITKSEAEQKTKPERYELLSKDPVTVARYFENRMTALLKLIFNQNTVFAENPNEDLFWRVDFQYRGSPHVHLLAWMKDAPKYSNDETDREYLENACPEFIDKYITCERPLNNLVNVNIADQSKRFDIKCQFHRHKANCKLVDADTGHETCKYGFPWPILRETCILEPLKKKTDDDKDKKRLYTEYFQTLRLELEKIATTFKTDSYHLKEIVSLDTLLDDLSLALDIPVTMEVYINILRSSIGRSTVFLKRNCRELMLNNYNKFIICHHRANMDIQFVTDPYGAAAYVSAYMLKSNAVMSATLKKAQIDIQKGNQSTRKKLLALANVFHNSSEIGAQEAVFTLLSMPVSKSSRNVIYINSYKSKDRNRMLKEQRYLDLIDHSSTDIYRQGLLDHYKMRPNTEEFKTMCLAEYASCYDRVSKAEMQSIINPDRVKRLPLFPQDMYDEDEDDFLGENSQDETVTVDNYTRQLDGAAYVRKRKEGKILRYKRYNRKRETVNFLRVQVMLYCPWKDAEKELENNENCNEIFKNNLTLIGVNRGRFETVKADDYDIAIEVIENELQDFYDELHEAEVENNRIAHSVLMANSEFIDPNDVNDEIEAMEDEHGFHAGIVDPDNDTYRLRPDIDIGCIKMPSIWPQEEYRNYMQKLNRLQQCIHHNIHGRIQNKETFNIFLTGASGTGKSAVLKAVYQTVWRTLKPINETSQFPVVVGAYTGKAAFNVKGLTLHSLFRLPTKGSKVGNLTNMLLMKCQQTFKYTVLIIIDEISMVSCRIFDFVVKRLTQVKEVEAKDLKISFLVVGDFRQLKPVIGDWIFDTKSNDVLGNLNWGKFEFFELTEVMRQRDDRLFAETLTTIGDWGIEFCTPEQVELLDSRIVSGTIDIPDESMILCHSNIKVKEYNDEIVSKCAGKIDNTANDHATGRQANTNQAKQKAKTCELMSKEDTNNLPYKITLALGKKYMVTSNINVADGLANGSVGRLKKIIENTNKDEGQCAVSRVYLLFDEQEVGTISRANNEHANIDVVDNDWTVIGCISPTIKRPAHGNYQIQREQLPLVECEAMTIHKSQGQTYNSCAVFLGGGLAQRLLYVALSRCTSLEGLYLFGAKTIQSKKLGPRALASLKKEKERQPTHMEIKRLRESCQLVNNYPFLAESYIQPMLSVMFANIENYGKNKDKCIQSDFGFMSCDIIMLCECHFKLNRLATVQIEGYNVIKATGRKYTSGSYGQFCYFKTSHNNGRLNFVGHNGDPITDEFSNEECELCMFVYQKPHSKPLYLINVYNHQSTSETKKIENFKNAFMKFIQTYIHFMSGTHLMLFGDFNIDFNGDKCQELVDDLELNYGLIPTLTNTSTRFRSSKKIQLDYVFTNMPQKDQDTKLYTSWFTDHSPLYTAIHNIN